MDHRQHAYESKKSRRTRGARHLAWRRSREDTWSKLFRVDILVSSLLMAILSYLGIALSLLAGSSFLTIAWLSLAESFYLMLLSFAGVYAIVMRSKIMIFSFAIFSVLNAIILTVILIMDSLGTIDIHQYYGNLHLLFLPLIPSGEKKNEQAQTAASILLWFLNLACYSLGAISYYVFLRQSREHLSIFSQRDSSRRISDGHHSSAMGNPPNPGHRHKSLARHPQPNGMRETNEPPHGEQNPGFSPTIDNNQNRSWLQGRRQLKASDDAGQSFGRQDSASSSGSNEPMQVAKSGHHKPKLHIVDANRNQEVSLNAIEQKAKPGTLEKEFPLRPG